MNEPNLISERRQRQERRRADSGPPDGLGERRINIERRLFNLGLDSGEAWLKAAAAGKWNARPLAAELSFSGKEPGPADCPLH